MTVGFPVCPECEGTGLVDGPRKRWVDPCPSCVEGAVITDELVKATARELHDKECVTDCPWPLDKKWLNYARVKLEAELRHLKEKEQ